MNSFFLITCFVAIWDEGILQQYRLLPTCDSSENSRSPIVLKGDKGDRGVPGKQGAKGIQGSIGVSGNDGVKGSKGDIANCSDLLHNLTERITRLEESIGIQQRVRVETARSCSESYRNGVQILATGEKTFCDNGWKVFQRRYDGSVSFNKYWKDYKFGFGNLSTEFWIGLEQLNNLTTNAECSLRVDLWDFDDDHAYAEYGLFRIESESNNYRLHVSNYTGTAGDSLISGHNNQLFSTRDRDNDNESGDCAKHWSGAWWYKDCFTSALNNPWGKSTGAWRNILWYSWKGDDEALKKTMMKIRCN